MKLEPRSTWPSLSVTNRLVAQLPVEDRQLLERHCESVLLQTGDTVGIAQPLACFPHTAAISLVDAFGVEIGLIGHESMSGWSVLLEDTDPSTQVIAACSGEALTLPTARLSELCRRSTPIRDAVLRSVESFTRQMMATIAVSARHSIRARLTRRLLMLHDRSSGDAFEVKHAQIAQALGVRRASVTDSLHVLEGEHVLRCRRNLIAILDRPALERAAGSAYGAAERIPG